MDVVNFTKIPGCLDAKASPEMSDMAVQPMLANGTMFIPGRDLMVGVKKQEESAAHVAIMTRIGDTGLYHSLTPDGARRFAQAILGAADSADAHLAKVTAAKLGATLAKRPRP
ncbi:hypothetical protein [Novosphingobium sp.]|uniref:hypothetical protein n=1 Tax=Novosphingobium sp. TaxID=1874826 RepID=UPI00286EA2C2|nr:hypothetical protein [Novosphingobium sp.]